MFTIWVVEEKSLRMVPILRAISPETPESISSKITGGSDLEIRSKFLIASISRDISPPEAILEISAGGASVLALKRKATESFPEGEKEGNLSCSTVNFDLAIPSFFKSFSTDFSILAKDF